MAAIKTLGYRDCPTCKGGQPDCITCKIRRRQENEPDTWYYKPRNYLQLIRAVTMRHESLPKSKVTDPWEDLERAKLDTDPLVWVRQVIQRGIAWGVNVDRIQVPLGRVLKRPPVVMIPLRYGMVTDTRFPTPIMPPVKATPKGAAFRALLEAVEPSPKRVG